ISGADSQVTLAGNRFEVNGYKRILLLENAMTGADFSLPMVDGLDGYELATKFSVPAGITLTVQPGVSIFGRSNAGLLINGGLVAQATPGKEIVFTSSANNAAGQWAGVVFSGADARGTLDGVALRYGGGHMPPYSDPTGSLIFSNLAPNAVQVVRSQISNSGTAGWQIFNSNITQNNILDGNRLISNTGYGLRISGASQVTLANTAVLNNVGDGIFLAESGVQSTLLQTTLAGNTSGVRTLNGSTATLTNTILSNNAVGVWAETGSTITLNSTLWDANATATTGGGAVGNNTPYSGSASFDPADGYHLTLYSQALGKGQNAGISTDIDGRSRPQPAGSSPDLGADEYNQSAATEMTAEKLAIPPVWINLPDPGGNPFGELVQKYWIRFLYGSNNASDPSVNISLEDILPGSLDFKSETHTPAMDFSLLGQTLQWVTKQPVSPRQTVDIHIDTRDSQPVAGSTYTNNATLNAGGASFDLSATTSVPVFTPLITWPANGELCPVPDHSLSVEGSAQPGTTIEIYEGSSLKGQAITDAQGLFKVMYTGSEAGLAALDLRARACAGDNCSGFTQVSLAEPQSFWDPQRSWWEGDMVGGPMAGKHVSYKFRDQDGLASSRNWIVPGVLGFSDTTLHLYACQDPATAKMPSQIWITADAHVYVPVSFSGNMYTYKIGAAHRVSMQATYRPDPPPDPPDPNDPPPPPPGYPPDPKPIHDRPVLIDPDGYVLNSTLGFDPQNPTQHVIPGAKVTAYVNMPGWGGWVPWPAHLYENQVNPQVVGSNGYFAFFTPAGQYYLQVDGPDGYQSWRSPVVTVVNEIVHVNIPLTPLLNGSLSVLQSSRAGFSQTELTIPIGGQVRWDIVQSPQEDSTSLVADVVNPLLHIISNPDAFASIDGWDSGRLYPGQSYTRQFNHPGDYSYTDSAGHTALIRVTDATTTPIYLPYIRR
ncbi:MAG: right-handed parallel beta-helix repeat-containing protein, partial [Anaerolineaceae bacterium]|nr:right-handed parallel beta-helix repeat-containing protein [Anaerolineaceae bacterium]